VRIYPGANAKFTLYEDDNETYNYERGEYATYELSWDDASRRLTVGPRKGSFPGMTRKRTLNVVLVERGTGSARSVLYDGKRVQIDFTSSERRAVR
jgi:alpha-D-xyloside xylohydrolase